MFMRKFQVTDVNNPTSYRRKEYQGFDALRVAEGHKPTM